jgi:hypothetical protein
MTTVMVPDIQAMAFTLGGNMNERFSELLSEYLDERERQNSNYYDNRYIGDRSYGREYMQELADKMDQLIHGIKE